MSNHSHLFTSLDSSGEYQDRELEKVQAEKLLNSLFPHQRDLVTDPSEYKAALCPRRAGKSRCILVYALHTALTIPDSKILVLARVMRQARGVYWNEVKKICRDFAIKAHFRNMPLNIELPNGSFIQFGGADTSEEVDKYRGQGFDLVAVDECKSYPLPLLRELLLEVIEPALLDRRGSLVLIGTPGPVMGGPFYAVTTGDVEAVSYTHLTLPTIYSV